MIELWRCVSCDLCGSPSDGFRPSATDARKYARKVGWTRRKVKGQMLDICPRCQPAHQGEESR